MPARIRLEAVIPKSAPDTREYEREVRNAVRTTGNEIGDDLEKTTETWTSRPTFTRFFRDRPPSAGAFTESDVYGYLNEGVPPRIIRAKNATMLRFQTEYTPKTQVKVLGSRAGGKSGPWTSKKEVNWPGIEARKWDEAIAEKYRRRFQARINIGIANANRKRRKLNL